MKSRLNICTRPRCEAGPLTNCNSDSFLLWQNFPHLRNLGNPARKSSIAKKPQRWQCLNAKLKPSFPTSSCRLESEWGCALGVCHQLGTRLPVRHKFTSPPGCLALQSGFQVTLGGELEKCFLCLFFPKSVFRVV